MYTLGLRPGGVFLLVFPGLQRPLRAARLDRLRPMTNCLLLLDSLGFMVLVLSNMVILLQSTL